jgi:mitochondrial import receptor subunit TOM20
VAEADAQLQRRKIRAAVDTAKLEGLPEGLEEKEQYFLDQVQQGEVLSADRELLPMLDVRTSD